MKRYDVVRRGPIVQRIHDALIASGARVLKSADPRIAPFEFTIETQTGEVLELVCYAFTANKYRQSGRPADEHRFQIKYGGQFDRYHSLFIDPRGRKLTLMFGVHLELDLFVAVDPRMHTPTWFSSSIEFKTRNLTSANQIGWHGWERERSNARRKVAPPQQSLQTETVIAFSPKYFLRYVEFERVASGLDCGERLLLSDRIEKRVATGGSLSVSVTQHQLEIQLGLAATEILDIVSGAFRLAAAVRGGVAEHHLKQQLNATGGLSRVRHINKDGQPDFEVQYRRRTFLIECKNVLARRTSGMPKVDFQKTRASKKDPCSRYYKSTQFDVLAACLHPVTQKWEFRFTPTKTLAPHAQCPGRLSTKVLVQNSWADELTAVLDQL